MNGAEVLGPDVNPISSIATIKNAQLTHSSDDLPTVPGDVTPDTPLTSLNLNW
uniref:Uncharacterized protein n=1 Tax=Candidatus Methanogaster sp. ANME-2c ERB4 TaxID=2759911 RepID=A0A7G9YRQ7_9EURY|nr:hypothetical protein HLBKPKBF_00009 [Methanosarcinales archaeon ANME-2c ERB4]